jgi:hypothetical protein
MSSEDAAPGRTRVEEEEPLSVARSPNDSL